MKLNHINLAVGDVAKTRAFFETYFGFRCIVERDPNTLVVLLDDEQTIVALNNFDKVPEVVYPEAFHIGFFQSSRERVDEIYQRLEADGLNPHPREDFHGAWTFYFKSPGGFTVEIAHQPQMAHSGN